LQIAVGGKYYLGSTNENARVPVEPGPGRGGGKS
jgi:hypothetical protein